MKISDRIKEFDAEIKRLKDLIPGLQCSNNMMTDRCQLLMAVGYVDENSTTFALDTRLEGLELIASRLLDSHITLMNRLYENVLALEKITGEKKWTAKPPKN